MRRRGAEHPKDPLDNMLEPQSKPVLVIGGLNDSVLAPRCLFAPCASGHLLVKAFAEAAKNATSRDAVLLSPVGSSFDQFRNHNPRSEVFCRAAKSISRGVHGGTPNINGLLLYDCDNAIVQAAGDRKNLLRGFLREKPAAKRIKP